MQVSLTPQIQDYYSALRRAGKVPKTNTQVPFEEITHIRNIFLTTPLPPDAFAPRKKAQPQPQAQKEKPALSAEEALAEIRKLQNIPQGGEGPKKGVSAAHVPTSYINPFGQEMPPSSGSEDSF